MPTSERVRKSKPGSTRKVEQRGEWPPLLQRFVSETGPVDREYLPRRVRRRFHAMDLTLWQGFVHVDDIHGYVENVRLRFYLNHWLAKRGDPTLRPATDDIYSIMLEADKEESQESRKPFHVERIAGNIGRNGVQEPIILYAGGSGSAQLWDGNRRFFGTYHIMRADALRPFREHAKWIPALVVTPSGSPGHDEKVKHAIITEMNFVEKDHIRWPRYVMAEQIYVEYQKRIAPDPADLNLQRKTKERLALEYGLDNWRVADRWIKMYDTAAQFKEYHEEEHGRATSDVDLKIQQKFEYFDELSKPAVWGSLKSDPDARDEVFNWLWDDKFKAFADVRMVPKILADPVARPQANADDQDSVKRAIETVIINDPGRAKDKESANAKIAQFGKWLSSFNRADYNQLDGGTLSTLRGVLVDVVAMLDGLLHAKAGGQAEGGGPVSEGEEERPADVAEAGPPARGRAKAAVPAGKARANKGKR